MTPQEDTFCKALLQKVIHNRIIAKGLAKGRTSCGTYGQNYLLQSAKGGVRPPTDYTWKCTFCISYVIGGVLQKVIQNVKNLENL